MWEIRKIVSKGDYNYVVVPEHPRASNKGYILEHRIVMENHLGRLLLEGEVVHHKNGESKDNRVENLEVLDHREHVRNHGLSRGRRMVMLQCPQCKIKFSIEKRNSFLSGRTEYNCCSGSCRGKFSRNIQLFGRTDEAKEAIEENFISEYMEYAPVSPQSSKLVKG